MKKPQAPTSQHKRSSKLQAPETGCGFRPTAFGIWSWAYLWSLVLGVWSFLSLAWAADVAWTDDDPLALLPVGAHQLRVLSPSVLELTLITTKPPDPARPHPWDLVDANLQPHLPAPAEFSVSVIGPDRDSASHNVSHLVPVQSVGFKRRVVYAPLRTRDLRIGNYLYLELASPVAEDQLVAVKIPDALLWQTTAPPATAPITSHQFPIANHGLAISKPFTATVAPSRWSPAIHVN